MPRGMDMTSGHHRGYGQLNFDPSLIWFLDAERADSIVDAVVFGTGRPVVTRATTKTRVNSQGLIEIVPANVLLRDFDPVTLAVRGFIPEETRTNLLLQSESLGTAPWVDSNAPIIAQDRIAPSGALTAWTVTDASVVALSRREQTIVVPNNNATYAVAIFVGKTIGLQASYPGFQFTLTGGVSVNFGVVIDTTNGILTDRAGNAPASKLIEDWGDYWRVIITGANNTSGNTNLTFQPLPAVNTNPVGNVFDGTVIGSAVFWGGTVENGSFATSYIPTTNVTVTRSDDLTTMPTSALTNFNPAAITMAGEWYGVPSTNAASRRIIQVWDGTSNNVHRLYQPSNETVIGEAVSGGVSQAALTVGGAQTPGALIRSAFAASLNSAQVAVNGAVSAEHIAVVMPVGVTQVSIGYPIPPCVPIRKLYLYNIRKSAAALGVMTA